MPYKPVGVDENSRFPPRVQAALAEVFITKPVGVKDGEVPVWDADAQKWVSKSMEVEAIDGGVWDPATQTWVNGSG